MQPDQATGREASDKIGRNLQLKPDLVEKRRNDL